MTQFEVLTMGTKDYVEVRAGKCVGIGPLLMSDSYFRLSKLVLYQKESTYTNIKINHAT